jgi:hypothetical protein
MIMTRATRFTALCVLAVLFAGCGGGGGGSSGSGSGGANQDPVVSLGPVPGGEMAVEASGQAGQVQLSRSGGGGDITVAFSVTGDSDPVKGSASSDDYELYYDDGNPVGGTTLSLAANENSRVIEVRPVSDSAHEVPETLTLTLESGTGYRLGSTTSAAISIVDADNTEADRKVFLGTFGPQDSAVTTASGTASLILQGDNTAARVNYNFFGLTS